MAQGSGSAPLKFCSVPWTVMQPESSKLQFPFWKRGLIVAPASFLVLQIERGGGLGSPYGVSVWSPWGSGAEPIARTGLLSWAPGRF